MLTHIVRFLKITAISLGTFLFIGCASGISHKTLVMPARTTLPDLSALGTLTSVDVFEGKVFVAGQKGCAGLDASGKELWRTELPQVSVRVISAGKDGVAASTYSFAGTSEGGAVMKFFMSGWSNQVLYENTKVEYLDNNGTLRWTTETPEKLALSRPFIGAQEIGVCSMEKLYVFDAASGALKINSPHAMFASLDKSKIGKTLNSQILPNQPVQFEGAWYSFAHSFAQIYKGDGKVERDVSFNLFNTYDYITTDPVVTAKNVVFGATPDRQMYAGKFAQIYSYKKGGKRDWRGTTTDKSSGIGAMTENNDLIFSAANFSVFAFDKKGKLKWKTLNGKGGLYPGTMRGVRYTNNIPSRKSPGRLMAATSANVYITSEFGKGVDVLTVLAAKNGAYVNSIKIEKPIVDLAAGDKNLIVLTPEQVIFLPNE